MLANGRGVAIEAPAVLKARIGNEVIEMEGPDAEDAIAGIRAIVPIQMAIRTTRGYRIGIAGSGDEVAKLATLAPRLVRFAIRPTTLDDVYFALTETGASIPRTGELVGDPA